MVRHAVTVNVLEPHLNLAKDPARAQAGIEDNGTEWPQGNVY